MKTIFVESEFEEEVVNAVINDIEGYLSEQQEDDEVVIRIYVESEGGHFKEVFKLIHYINYVLPENVKIELYANHYVQSGAALMFLVAKCYKDVLPTTFGMLHEASRSLDIQRISRDRTKEHFLKEELNFINDRMFKFLSKCGVSDEGIQRMKDGYDLYFTTEEFIDLIKQSDKIDGYNFFY